MGASEPDVHACERGERDERGEPDVHARTDSERSEAARLVSLCSGLARRARWRGELGGHARS